MLASGFAGLGYQIVWTQQFALLLGHESAAVLAVVSAFFGGLGLGAFGFGPRIARSPRPERWYAACEAVIALWSVALAMWLAPIGRALLAATGAQPSPAWQWGVAFVGTFVLLLPATAAMGATLPAMDRVVARFGGAGNHLASLYASNTFGAVLGVLATAFWLVPTLGLSHTVAVCALLNAACAVAALRLASPGTRLASAATAPAPAATAEPTPPTPVAPGSLWPMAATGLLGIGYEVLVVRVLSQVSEDTVYTFAMLLAVYLVGSASGAAIYQRWLSPTAEPLPLRNHRPADPDRLGDSLLCLQAAACLLGTASLWGAEGLRLWALDRLGTLDALGGISSPGSAMAAAVAAEAALALAAFALPTVVMGALFSHLASQARATRHGVGRALGSNTLGAALAPPLFGVLLVPALGPKVALLLVAAAYLALTLPRARSAPVPWAFWATAGAAGVLGLVAPPLSFIDVPEGGRVLSYREGAMAAVSVVEDAGGVARLRINNRQQEGSSATRLADARQAWLPLLLHPAPQRALFLGLGTGITAASAAEDPTLRVDAVELLPEVIAAAAHFAAAVPTAAAADGAPAPRLTVIAADARRFVKTTDAHYDVIVSDNFHPARSGSGSLYTAEHFEAVRERLSRDGVFCQWLPLHQLDLETLRSVVQSFMAVYPEGGAMLATNSLETPVIGLVGRRAAGRFDLREVRARLAGSRLPQRLAELGIADEFALLGSFIAGPQALARFAGDAPLNTDDHPVVAYRAPRITYAPDSAPRERLSTLLQRLAVAPAELVDTGPDTGAAQRLAAYRAARERFIEVGLNVRPSADAGRMLHQVREPLLAVLRVSPDFRPAYDPLLRMASALAATDPAAARLLLAELSQLHPARAEAGQMLARLTRTPRP